MMNFQSGPARRCALPASIFKKSILTLSAAAMILLSSCAKGPDDPLAPSHTLDPDETITAVEPSAPVVAPENTPVVTPAAPVSDPTSEPTPEHTPEPTPAHDVQEVPEQEAVGDDFFDDAALLGNSLADGFRLYSGITNMDVYASTSMTIFGVDGLLSQMAGNTYGKIYTFLGINEIYTTLDAFSEQYGKIIDTLQKNHPGADIYIISITPVSKTKATSNTLFSMDNIHDHNQALYDLAGEKGCYYLDLCSAMENEEGYLPEEVTFDGVHFTASHYKVWLEFLKTHYVPGDAAE